jgi:2-keto-myo-inositol isomerase
MVAPRAGAEAFFAMAGELGLGAVEIRNDLAGVAIADGTGPDAIREAARRHGLRILSINALQRFNDWTPERAVEARALATYARACGAEALVLCPVNDRTFRPREPARLDGIRRALSELAPILADSDVLGLVEPLGFAECSLRLKREAVEAIDAVGGGGIFKLVHDTFHHAVAGEDAFFPERTGLAHISGVEDAGLALSSMRDPHRVLVGPRDRIGNAGQVARLLAGGCAGYLSFEPFAGIGGSEAEIVANVRRSMDYLSGAAESRAA